MTNRVFFSLRIFMLQSYITNVIQCCGLGFWCWCSILKKKQDEIKSTMDETTYNRSAIISHTKEATIEARRFIFKAIFYQTDTRNTGNIIYLRIGLAMQLQMQFIFYFLNIQQHKLYLGQSHDNYCR